MTEELSLPADLDPRARAILLSHAALLARWRGAMDLVGPGPIAPHFTDAIGAVTHLAVAGQWADLGSGAGFPGVALAALYPGARVLLVESRQKRAIFLQRVLREAQVDNATVHAGRSEALADGSLYGFVSRAYKPPARVLDEDARRLLRPGGQVVLLLGDDPDVQAPAGFVETDRRRYAVEDGHRVRVVMRREAP